MTNNRIAIFIPSLLGGGAERVMTTLANGFVARGLGVDLVLAQAQGPYLEGLEKSVRVVNLERRRVLTSIPALVKYLRTRQPLAMISAMNYANIVAIWAKRLSGAPTLVIVTEHNTLSRAQLDARSLRQRLMPWLMRRAYRHAGGIIAVSRGVAADLATVIGVPRERIHVVYNPIETRKLKFLCNAEPIPPSFLDDAIPVILATGNFCPQKDFSTLIKAFARVRQQRSARLVILGDGELRNEMQTLIYNLGLSDDALLPGYVKNPFAWMRRASLFVLSSAWEGFGLVLVEAMACGTPVVSTDCPSGPAEILENGKWGALVPVGDVNALACAMSASLDSSDHPDVCKRAADFDVDLVVDRYLELLPAELVMTAT